MERIITPPLPRYYVKSQGLCSHEVIAKHRIGGLYNDSWSVAQLLMLWTASLGIMTDCTHLVIELAMRGALGDMVVIALTWRAR